MSLSSSESSAIYDDEAEAANSDDERSSQAFVTKDPYYPYPQNYPYPQDWFGHDEEDADDLAKD